MAKYSYDFKKQIVDEYLNGEGGYGTLAKKYGFKNHSQIEKWIKSYNSLGEEGLRRSRKQTNYSFKYKLSVVESYLTSEISYQELAIQEGISNPAMITNWVNRFRAAGPDALRSRKKGRKKTMDTQKKESTSPSVEERIVDTSAEHVKELEDELLKLRIENAILKELRRLRLEDEAKMRERRESSTVSEENSS